MKKLGWMVALVVIAVACGSGADMMGEIMDSGVPDAGAQPGDGSSMQYVGNSTAAFLGADMVSVDGEPMDQGIYDYYAACQDTFGPGHRMRTREEIIFTTQLPQLADGFAWYDPTAKCNRVDTNNSQRAAVNQVGTLSTRSCRSSPSDDLPIACCGPK
jgi:hypothetical protein